MNVVWVTYLDNNLKPGRNELRAYRERWQARPRSITIGLTSSVTRQRSWNSSRSCQTRLPPLFSHIWNHRSQQWQWPLHASLWMLMLSSSSLASTLPWLLSIHRQISGFVNLHINPIRHILSFMTRPVTWSLWKSLQGVSYLSKELDSILLMREALLQHTRCRPGWHLNNVLPGPGAVFSKELRS